MAIRLAMLSGVTFIGAPIVGTVADRFGPRWAMALGAASCLVAALIGLREWFAQTRPPISSQAAALPADDEVEPA